MSEEKYKLDDQTKVDSEEIGDNYKMGFNYPFKGMIFEGGGSLGVAHVGAVKVFKDLGILKNIKYFVGSSAGAIAAGALACGADPMQLYDILFNTDFNTFKDDSFGIVRDLSRFVNHFGWYKGDALEKWYGDVLDTLTGNRSITFAQAHKKFGTNLVITVTDVNLGKTIYLSHATHPDMMIKKAVRRSSIMPLIFRADHETLMTNIFKDDKVHAELIKHYFTDGGLLNNYPIRELDGVLKHDEIVGFRLMTTLQLAEIRIPELQSKPNPPSNVVDYIFMLYEILRNQALKLHVDKDDWKRTVKIDVKDMSATDFDMSNESKQFLIDQGKQAAQDFLNKFLEDKGITVSPAFNFPPHDLTIKSKKPKKTVGNLNERRSSVGTTGKKRVKVKVKRRSRTGALKKKAPK